MASLRASSPSLVDLQHDHKYRKYVQAVERILQTFDAINEWADVIRFLTSLTKAPPNRNVLYLTLADTVTARTVSGHTAQGDCRQTAGAVPESGAACRRSLQGP